MGSANIRITVAADDGQVDRGGAGSYSSTFSDHDMGQTGGDSEDQHYRFPSVPIPKESKITSAIVRFVGFGGGNTGVTCTEEISGDDIDDAVAPTSVAEFDALTLTTARVAWVIPSWGTTGGGVIRDSPDISTIVQEIVDRSGWATGQAMQILFHDNGSDAATSRTVRTEGQGDGLTGPRLIMSWASPGEIWVESEAFHWHDANALERFVIGSAVDHAATPEITSWLGL